MRYRRVIPFAGIAQGHFRLAYTCQRKPDRIPVAFCRKSRATGGVAKIAEFADVIFGRHRFG